MPAQVRELDYQAFGEAFIFAAVTPERVIGVVLVATGVVGAGFIFAALMCTAMMWVMMRAMSQGNNS